MTSVVDLQPGQRTVGLSPAGDLSLNGPGSVLGSQPSLLSRPLHGRKQVDATNVVADQILVTRVYNNSVASTKSNRDIEAEGFISVNAEALVDAVRAFRPSARNTNSLLNRGLVEEVIDLAEIVAKRSDALLSDIVVVDSRIILKNGLHDATADVVGLIPLLALDGLGALGVGLIHLLGSVRVDETLEEGIRSIRAVLDERRDPAVADTQTNLVNLELALSVLVGLEDVGRKSGHIVSTIAFTYDVEGRCAVLRELLEEQLQESIHSSSYASFIINVAVLISDVGETSANRLINVEQVGKSVPGVRIELQCEVRVHSVGSILGEKGKGRSATRSTSHPEDEGISSRVALGLKEPIEEISALSGVIIDIASVLFEFSRED